MGFHTNVKNEESLWYGSGIVEVAVVNVSPSWEEVGAVRGFGIAEPLVVTDLTADNARIKKYVSDQKITLSFEMLEFNLSAYEIMRSLLDTFEDVAAAPVNAYNLVVPSGEWNYEKFIPFDHQMGTGAKITPTSVTGSVDGALVLDTDYFIVKYGTVWGIYIIDSTTVTTEAQIMTIIYDYTPNATKEIYSGGKTEMGEFMIRFTNKDENNKIWRITVYLATLDKGLEKTFLADDAEEISGMTMACTGNPDINRTKGKQSYLIETERGL